MKKEAIDVLLSRRSVRKFKAVQIPEEALLTVLEAGTYAPTGRNRQTPWIIAIQNKEERDAFSALNSAVKGQPGDPYYGAPTILVVAAPADGDFGMLNGAAVITNMLNAAQAAGLNACWIHTPRQIFDGAQGQAFLEKWGIASDCIGIGSIALGYGDMPVPAAAPRKEGYYRIIK